ncbi:MAG: pyridoxamine 5'-phosphate oxidase family protein [Desulfovibrio sp.]|nr:pyridoxamine 5'-phosphate oxidase family protein [Desulfovibrio sp.]MBO6170556.1 pyridoxamine 5'-phosphate oxidase family protein [Desulfovibrio sp.]
MLFRELRRKKQQLPEEACRAILARGTSGVLAVAGDGGYPYAVPLSYVYDGERIFFHCALSGHKLDAIARDDRVSFCVIDRDDVQPETYTTHFASVIVFGRARVLDEPGEKRRALEKLAARYSPEQEEGRTREISRLFDRVCMLELRIEHMSGKQARELAEKPRA